MFKKMVLGIIILLVVVGLVRFVVGTVLSDPQKIYNKVMPGYKSLSGRQIKEIVYSKDREIRMLMSYANIIPLGQVKLSVREFSARELKLTAQASTPGWIDAFYDASAMASSLVDKVNFYPSQYFENISYGDKKETKEIVFDQKRHIASREGNKYKIPSMTFCPISALYYLQVQNLKPESIHQIRLITKEEIYLLEAKVIEINDDVVKLSGQVKREDLSSQHGAEFQLWISAELRIPLLFKVKTPFGQMIARTI